MKAWTLNPPTQSPGDLQHSWAQTKDVGTIGALKSSYFQGNNDDSDNALDEESAFVKRVSKGNKW